MDQITNTNQIIFNDLSMKEAFRIWCKAHCIKIRKPLTNVPIWFRREIKRNCIWEYYEKRYSIRFSLKYILDLKDPFIKEISQNKNEVIPLLSLMNYRHFIISNGKRLYADNLTPNDIVYILSDNGSIDIYKIRHIDIPFLYKITNIDMSFVFKVVESSTSHDIILESDMIILHLSSIASTNEYDGIFSVMLEKAILNVLYSKLSNNHNMSCEFTYYKIVNSDFGIPGNQKYKEGINSIPSNHDILDPSETYGIFYTSVKYIFNYINYGPILFQVFPLNNSIVISGMDDTLCPEWRSDRLKFSKPMSLHDPDVIDMLIQEGADVSASDFKLFRWAILYSQNVWNYLKDKYPEICNQILYKFYGICD